MPDIIRSSSTEIARGYLIFNSSQSFVMITEGILSYSQVQYIHSKDICHSSILFYFFFFITVMPNNRIFRSRKSPALYCKAALFISVLPKLLYWWRLSYTFLLYNRTKKALSGTPLTHNNLLPNNCTLFQYLTILVLIDFSKTVELFYYNLSIICCSN
jgi:hypothetical protein